MLIKSRRRHPVLVLLAVLLVACSGKDAADGDTTDAGADSSPGEVLYGDCSSDTDCALTEICAIYENGNGVEEGLRWCALPCDVAGDGSDCPPVHADSETTPVCDAHPKSGDGMCALDCGGGFACPDGMECWDGRRCLWEH